MPATSRVVTLYRLPRVSPSLDGLFDALDAKLLDELGFIPLFPDYPDAVAYLVKGHFTLAKAEWCHDASMLTGLELDLEDKKSAALLLIAVDGQVYAIGFGQGFRLVPDMQKDPYFGLSFAIRAVNPDQVRDVVRRSMTGEGRQDATLAPKGIPIRRVGVRQCLELVKTLGGKIRPADLGLGSGVSIAVVGSAGLRLPIPVDATRIVEFLRRVNEICARQVRTEFQFIDAIKPVRDTALESRLDGLLDQGLVGAIDIPLAPAIPVELVSYLGCVGSYRIRIGSSWLAPRPDLELSDILQRCRVQYCVSPAAALRDGRIEICAGRDGTEPLGGTAAIKWLEASVVVEDRHYFLIDGAWYESGAGYLDMIRRRVHELIRPVPNISLPPWRPGEHERNYNLRVQHEAGRAVFLCLDRTSIRTELHRTHGIEPCDLYGPDGEFIHIKAASGSSPLSHQFNQALVSVETLILQPGAWRRFAELAQHVSGSARSIPLTARPKKVILGILLKDGQPLSPGTLFPFAQVALVNMADTLMSAYGVEVEVIGISRA